MKKLLYVALLLFLTGCGRQPAALTDFLPQAGAIAGWNLDGAARLYTHDNLYDMVDGQADAFFVYGFEQVAVQRYKNGEAVLEVAIWQLATPADAYGLFTSARTGQPVAIGNEGDADPGSRLSFWQNRYQVQVYGRKKLADADLQAFAKAVAAALPQGGERPALVSRLPKDGQVERGFIFFHEEISVQNDIWLGGANILGLSSKTNGVLAWYDLGATTRLLLIEYPDAQAASTGLSALKTSQVEELAAADARANLLGAVFGPVDPAAAGKLVTESLDKK